MTFEQRWLLAAATLTAAAVVVTVLLLTDGDNVAMPPASGPASAATAEIPSSFRGIKDGHLRQVELATGKSTDLGPATSFGGSWIATSTGTCQSRVVDGGHGFEVGGAVNAMALSPDGTTLAYSRSAPRPVAGLPEYPCGNESLGLRNVATGSERVWTGDEGYVASLTWRPDSNALAFQTAVCCDADITIKAFDVSRPTGPLSTIPPAFTTSARYLDPVWNGETLDVLEERDDTTWRVVVGGIGTVLATLPDQGVSLDESSNGWLLVALYGSGDIPGRLLALHKGQQPRELGTGYEQARWG